MRTLILKEQFEKFIQDKLYLDNLAATTIRSYRLAFKWFEPYGLDQLDEFVIALRKAGMKPGGCNVKIRSINSFLSWLHARGHCEYIKIKTFKSKAVVPYQLNDAHVRALIKHKPVGRVEKRLHTIILLCIDTGIRIDECLTLSRRNIDFDNLLITVTGKGDKERIIPFSIELRKTLFKHIRTHDFDLVFCTWHGMKLGYHNVRRDLKGLTKRLGINCGFHDLRRFFITNAIKNGVSPIIVQRMAGHSSFAVTQRYIYLITNDMSRAHAGTSALSRFR